MWSDLDGWAPPERGWEKALKLGLIGGLHVVLIAGAVTMTVRPELLASVKQITVRLIEERPPEPPKAEPTPPRPLPQVPRPVIRREAQPPPQPPVMTAEANAPLAATSFTVPPQPPPAPVQEVQPAPAPPAPPVPVTEARFDADYLHNPKPVYPALSRRQGEQGKVVLQVRVLADGSAAKVQIKASSGFPRLDEAALEAVTQWRFVPARRGDQRVDAWVLVPINFALNR